MVAPVARFIPSSPSAQEAIRTIKAFAEARIPFNLVGPPGNGKSSIIEAIAHELGYDNVEVVIGSQLHPTEAAGLPIVVGGDTDSPTTVKALPDWFRRAIEIPKTVLFFDEWLNTPAATQAALLVFIQTGILGGHKLPCDTIVLMAGNPDDSGANSQPLTQPMANRIGHGLWNPEDADWFEGMMVNWNLPADERLTEERLRIVAFLQQPEYTGLLSKGPKDEVEASGAHPSWRSWDNVAKALAKTNPTDEAVRGNIVRGLVGDEAFAAFSVWDAGFRLPDIDEVLNDPEAIEWSEKEADFIYGVLAMAVGSTTPDNAMKVANLLAVIGQSDTRRDIGAGMVTPFISKTAGVAPDERMSAIRNLSNVYKDILQAAGMLAA